MTSPASPCFLASGASNFITGAVITVDGGYSVQG
jgi:enoyl-[acyl-carrier-protein] reductase (NADH)